MWGRPADFYALAAVLGMALFSPLVLTALAVAGPEQYHRTAALYLTFPLSLEIGVMAIGFVDVLFAALLAASTMGSEYADNTWKLIVPRRGRRGGIIVAKLAVALLTATGAAAVALALWVIGAALCRAYGLGLPIVGPGGERLASVAAVTFAVSLLRMLVFGAVAALTAVVSRSALIGVATGFLMPGLLDLVAFRSVAVLLPNAHLWNLRATFVGGETAGQLLRNVYGVHSSVEVSLLVIAAYVALAVTACVQVFKRQELPA